MNTQLLPALPRALLMTMLVCAACAARAQDSSAPPPAPSPVEATAPADAPAPVALPPSASASDAAAQNLLDRHSQKIEHLHFEDAGNTVDEVRVGGQTQSITVQPKGGAPAYEVQPVNPNTVAPDAGIGQTGPRLWRIHQF